MIPIVSFVGKSGSGKTTLLEKVIRELKLRGCRVAVIKHSPHGFDIDPPGKDTWRLAQAGSDVIVNSSPQKMAFVERISEELPLDQVAALIGDKVDIVLTEGYKRDNSAKILVSSLEQSPELHCGQEKLLAIVSDRPLSGEGRQFDHDDVVGVADLLIRQIGESLPHKSKDAPKAANVISRFSEYQMGEFEEFLAESVALHGHICPGQVLGVRMAMRGCRELDIEKPMEDKRLVVYVEIDRCATDAIQVVTGCKLGKRTMKYVDYGKLAATFLDLNTKRAVRLAAREDIREKAALWCHERWTKEEAEVAAYRAMSDEELFDMERVHVQIPPEDMPGPPIRRVICEECGEGINDCREVIKGGQTLCRSCAYGRYYEHLERDRSLEICTPISSPLVAKNPSGNLGVNL